MATIARLSGATGTAATYVVAANDAPAHIKAQADYVCDGVADEVEINAAFAALPGGLGTVHLSTGTFTLAAPILMNGSYSVTLEGEGNSSILSGAGVTTPIRVGTTGLAYKPIIRNLYVSSGNPYNIEIVSAHQALLENLRVFGGANTTQAIRANGHLATIRNNMVINCTDYGIYATGNDIIIEHNDINAYNYPLTGSGIYYSGGGGKILYNSLETFYNGIVFDGTQHRVQIVGNYFEGGNGTDISVGGGYNHRIADNYSNGASTAVNSIVLGINQSNITVEGNYSLLHTGKSLVYPGYNYGVMSFRNNYFTDVGGSDVLEDYQVEKIRSILGPYASNSHVLLPFELGTVMKDFGITDSAKDAVFFNTPTWGTVTSTGKKKVTLNGTTQYIRIPGSGDNLVSASGSRTWIAAVSPNFAPAEAVQRRIFDWNDTDPNNRVIIYKASGSGTIGFYHLGAGTATTASGTVSWTAGDILVIVATFDTVTGIGKLYSNGLLIGSFTGGVSPAAGVKQLLLGSLYTFDAYFWEGDFLFFEQLPYAMTTVQITDITKRLAKWTGGVVYSEILTNKFDYAAPGATSWTPQLEGAGLAASLVAQKTWIPLENLNIGDQIVSYRLQGDATETTLLTLDAKLVRVNLANPLTTTDVAGGAITQIIADGSFDSEAVLTAPEVVATDKQYKIEVLGTTGALDSITVIGAKVKIIPAN